MGWSNMKAYNNEIAFLKSVVISIMYPPGDLNPLTPKVPNNI